MSVASNHSETQETGEGTYRREHGISECPIGKAATSAPNRMSTLVLGKAYSQTGLANAAVTNHHYLVDVIIILH